MSTTRGGKRRKPKSVPDEIEESQPTEAGSPISEGKKRKDRRFGKRKLTGEELAEWRASTYRKMKRSPKGTLTTELPGVLVSVLEEAHDGSCQHAKFLFDFMGTESPLPDKKEEKKNQSLAELLVSELGARDA